MTSSLLLLRVLLMTFQVDFKAWLRTYDVFGAKNNHMEFYNICYSIILWYPFQVCLKNPVHL